MIHLHTCALSLSNLSHTLNQSIDASIRGFWRRKSIIRPQHQDSCGAVGISVTTQVESSQYIWPRTVLTVNFGRGRLGLLNRWRVPSTSELSAPPSTISPSSLSSLLTLFFLFAFFFPHHFCAPHSWPCPHIDPNQNIQNEIWNFIYTYRTHMHLGWK